MIINLDNTCHNIGLNRIAAMGLKAKKSYFLQKKKKQIYSAQTVKVF